MIEVDEEDDGGGRERDVGVAVEFVKEGTGREVSIVVVGDTEGAACGKRSKSVKVGSIGWPDVGSPSESLGNRREVSNVENAGVECQSLYCSPASNNKDNAYHQTEKSKAHHQDHHRLKPSLVRPHRTQASSFLTTDHHRHHHHHQPRGQNSHKTALQATHH